MQILPKHADVLLELLMQWDNGECDLGHCYECAMGPECDIVRALIERLKMLKEQYHAM